MRCYFSGIEQQQNWLVIQVEFPHWNLKRGVAAAAAAALKAL
jgi:hypothetical protein